MCGAASAQTARRRFDSVFRVKFAPGARALIVAGGPVPPSFAAAEWPGQLI